MFDMKVKLTFAGLETVINESDLPMAEGEYVDIGFGGCMMVQFIKTNGDIIPTNAVNGWGNNCFEEVKGEELTLKKLD